MATGPATGPRIVFAAAKEAAAQRLADALAADGYPAQLSRIASTGDVPEGAAAPAPSPATILIWSKATMASAAAVAIADSARQRGTLVEVSIDGLAPVASQDRLALLSGWRGEPFHPGWQKIRGEVARLCGPAAARRPERRPAAAATAASAAHSAAAAPPNRRNAPPLALLFGCLLLLLMAGVAGAAWMSRDAAPDAAANIVPDLTGPAEPEAPPPNFDPAAFIEEPAEPVSAADTPPPSAETRREAAVARRSTPAPATKTRIAARAPDPARTMRLFCEGSGRSSPECRRFRRAAGSSASERSPDGAQPARYRNARNMRRFCESAGRATPQCRAFLRDTRRR